MNQILRLVLVIAVVFLFAGCGSDKFELSADQFNARLTVPDQQLPEGYELDDITIRVVPGGANAVGLTHGSTEEFPDGELLAEIELLPSRITFDPPAELELSLPVDGDGALYEFLLASADEEEGAPVQFVEFNKDRTEVAVTVEIAHFSKLRLRRSDWYNGASNKFYQVDVRTPVRASVGDSFDAYAEVRRRNDVTVWSRDVLDGGFETRMTEVDSANPWRLTGAWDANEILSPRELQGRPPRTQVANVFKVQQEFKCERAGTGQIYYISQAESRLRSWFRLESNADGSQLEIRTPSDLQTQPDWLESLDVSEQYVDGLGRKLEPFVRYTVLVRKVEIICEGQPATPTSSPTPYAIPTVDPDQQDAIKFLGLFGEGYGVSWANYSFDEDPEMSTDGRAGFEFEVERIQPAERQVEVPFQVRVRAFFDHPDLPAIQRGAQLGVAVVSSDYATENLELVPEHTTSWLKRDFFGFKDPPRELLAVATFKCTQPGPASYTIFLSGAASYWTDRGFGEITSPTQESGEGQQMHEFKVDLTCVAGSGQSATPTPGSGVTVGSGGTGDGSAGDQEFLLVNPCEAVDLASAAAVLGNPVDVVPPDEFSGPLYCNYWVEEQPLDAFWTASMRIREADYDLSDLRRFFFVDRGFSPPYAEFLVLNDEEGLVADLLDAGTVSSPDGSPFPVSRGESRPDIGSVVLINKYGNVGGLGSAVTLMAKLRGHDVWIEIDVSMTEPWDLSGVPVATAEAIIASLPRIDAHVTRAVDLAALLVKGLAGGVTN